MEIWYNPKCSKCRVARQALDEAGVGYELRDYQQVPPTVDELREVLGRLGVAPRDITRFNEPVAHEVGLTPSSSLDDEAWIALLATNPGLIQRPILLLDDGSALIGRDPTALERAVSVEKSE